MKRRAIIAGNWKMNKTSDEAKELAVELVKALKHEHQREFVLCPTFTSLHVVRDAISQSSIKLGAQNMYFEKNGAFTGEISPLMLRDAGCAYVIIGHSERRQYFGEDEALLNKKIKSSIESGLIPIYCVGETKQERDAGKAKTVVEKQIKEGLNGVLINDAGSIVIAYEPVWAIGTGDTATPQDAQAMHSFIRGLLNSIYGITLASGIRIQYGGSVKADNVDELMACPDIDGALVGGASLKADSFIRICLYKEI